MRVFSLILLLASWTTVASARHIEADPTIRDQVARLANAAPADADSLQVARVVYEGLRAEGWLWARVAVHPERVAVESGPRATLVDMVIGGTDAEQIDRFRRALGWRIGEPYRPGDWDRAALRAVTQWGELGRPFARVNVRRIDADPATGEVTLDLWLAPGPAARVQSVSIEGATSTRPDVLAKLAGISPGQAFRQSDLDRIKNRLEAREVVDRVTEVTPRPRGVSSDEVDLTVRVEQPESTGRIAAALGVVQDATTQRARVSGRIDLALLDLFGTARQFEIQWLDDGRERRNLDLSYVEPVIFGSGLDLALHVGQRHQDALYDSVLLDVDLQVPWRGEHGLELGLGVDRTTFEGEDAVVRSRRKARAALSLGRRRPHRGLFGNFATVVEAVRVQESSRGEEGRVSEETTGQTILDASVQVAMAFSPRWAIQTRARWQRVATDELPLPVSEQWRLGGATSVRGYEEDRFSGEQTAFGGLELQLGAAERAVGYAFVDAGWVEETQAAARLEHWLSSFGAGLRAPVASGFLDVSLGFAGRPSFEEGKLHVALDQRF